MKQNVSIIIEVYGFIDRRNFLILPSGLTISVQSPVTESREYGNPIHSQNDVRSLSQNASYCHFESLIFKIKVLRSNLNKSIYVGIYTLELHNYMGYQRFINLIHPFVPLYHSSTLH